MEVHINLEQNINAEAKISLRGITAYAGVPFVINRGIITNVMRTQLANWLLELVNLLHVYNGNKKLRESKSERDKTVIDQTKDLLELTPNPTEVKSNKNILFTLRKRCRIAFC